MSVFKDHLINRLLLERNEPAQRAGKSTQRDSNSRSKPIRSRSETRQKSTSSELTRELPSRALVRQPGQAVVRTNKIADSTDSTERISHALVAKLRQRATKRYVCRLVRPVRFDFQPKNWQDRPAEFEEIVTLPDPKFLGRADAWRFMHNTSVMRNQAVGAVSVWAILDVEEE